MSSYRCHSKFEMYFPTPLDRAGELTTPLSSYSGGKAKKGSDRRERRAKEREREKGEKKEERCIRLSLLYREKWGGGVKEQLLTDKTEEENKSYGYAVLLL